MPPILNANAIIACSHGGTFKIIPMNPMKMAGGAPIVTLSDVAPGSVPMTPCPFLTPAGVPAPCVKLGSATGGMATKVSVNGVPVLLATTQFITIGPMPVPAMVTFPGQMTVQGM